MLNLFIFPVLFKCKIIIQVYCRKYVKANNIFQVQQCFHHLKFYANTKYTKDVLIFFFKQRIKNFTRYLSSRVFQNISIKTHGSLHYVLVFYNYIFLKYMFKNKYIKGRNRYFNERIFLCLWKVELQHLWEHKWGFSTVYKEFWSWTFQYNFSKLKIIRIYFS